MKNLILLIFTLLFGFSAVGADKPKTEFDKQGNLVTDIGAPKFSRTGLEGWGKYGVRINVVDYSKEDKNFPLKEIKTKVELRLRQAGIKIGDKSTGNDILIHANPIIVGDRLVGYAVNIRPRRPMKFQVLDNVKIVTYETMAICYSYSGIAPASGLVKYIDSQMDQLLLDYLKANPKK